MRACAWMWMGQCLWPMWLSMWTDGEAHERFAREAKEGMAILDAQLVRDGKRFFAGDQLGYVDIAACSLAHWLYVMEEATGVRLVADGEFPALRRWGKEYTSHEAVKRSLPDRDQLVAFFTANKDKLKSEVRAVVDK
jgi:glutathione S-transferase